MCCDAPDPPQPDPAIGEAAKANAEVAREVLEFNKQQYEDSKPRIAAAQKLIEQIVGAQVGSMEENRALARDYADYMKGTFRPVEQGLVYDAHNLNAEEIAELEQLKGNPSAYAQRLAQLKDVAEQREIERAAGEAAADVGASSAASRGVLARDLARMGLDPSSGAYAAAREQGRFADTAAQAGAANQARNQARTLSWARRMDAASLGRNLPGNQATSAQIATSTGNAAAGNAGAGANLGLPAQAMMNQGYGQAVQANTAAGGLYGQIFNAQMQGYNAQQAADASMWGGIGSLVGTGIGAYAAFNSSKKIKRDKEDVSDAEVLEKVEDMPVDRWRYKAGSDDGGAAPHMGPYAEDFQERFGVGDGQQIRMVDAVGVSLAALKGLTRKVEKLEKAVKQAA